MQKFVITGGVPLKGDVHIAGAKNLPADQIAADPKALGKLSDKTVVLYCDTGMTTAAAQRTLTQAGAKNVFSLRGGLAAWRSENLPLVKADAKGK